MKRTVLVIPDPDLHAYGDEPIRRNMYSLLLFHLSFSAAD